MKVRNYSDNPKKFEELKSILVLMNNSYEEYEIENVRYQKEIVLLKLKNVDTIEQAEKLKGHSIFINRKDAKYEGFLERMNELFSDKNEFIKAELSLISRDMNLKKYFEKEVSKKPEREKFLSSIYLIIKNENGEVLLQRRQGTKLWPGYLALPAGHIDQGENAYEAAIREAKEELGIEIQVEDIIDTFVANRKNKSLPSYYDVYFEVSKYLGEIRIAEPEKCSELVWANPANLPNDMIDFEKEAMENNANGIKFSVTYADNEKKLMKTKK